MICMGDDLLAGPCTSKQSIANFVGALWSVGDGAWFICDVVCFGCFVGGNLFIWGYFVKFLLWGDPGVVFAVSR